MVSLNSPVMKRLCFTQGTLGYPFLPDAWPIGKTNLRAHISSSALDCINIQLLPAFFQVEVINRKSNM